MTLPCGPFADSLRPRASAASGKHRLAAAAREYAAIVKPGAGLNAQSYGDIRGITVCPAKRWRSATETGV